MGEPVVEVADLMKTFRVSEREEGLGATVRSVFRRRYRDVQAVAGISFGIEPGEVVGFLGPNGAGKTTTLKMLSGLLFPTSGRATVLGHVPWRREDRFLSRVSARPTTGARATSSSICWTSARCSTSRSVTSASASA
ncbi:MAG: ATP-binding cassette domain-containing protein [Chloroflexi bacterium]|nr:MAG: ATP-binding cassette domain-containing protein [Chloroflexota bacterium]